MGEEAGIGQRIQKRRMVSHKEKACADSAGHLAQDDRDKADQAER
ncbi:hypothetical protein GCWU000342_01774 [Shuttleworthella satelles DSM 14600]|uniref:Uncharacterized protein n=1 Tax=Shuttleworthella satelles DSM 14600 TaxID=626523 RepID=C4GCT0_9FIRM|nr:hypothetical protein GCWU000342_01774 [Shuttleworthia satelles DSM 14600]